MNGSQQYCTFYVAGRLFGVEVLNVQEVIRCQAITRVPLAPFTVQGLINLRGQIVPVIDLRRRLGLPERPAEEQPLNVVVRTEEGAVSWLVDEIGDVLETAQEAFERPPETLRADARKLIRGAYKLDGQLLLVLDIQHTVSL
jgi:purine-binding chemotaxis protein CheW